MKVLITGVAGFIGSNLAEHLLNQNYFVVGLDNFITGSQQNIARLSKYENFTFFRTDVSYLEPQLKNNLQVSGFDEVYHLACPTGVPNLEPLAEEMLLANSSGIKNILDIAVKNDARLIMTSSSEVYGDPEVFPQEESYTGNVNPIGPRSPYEEGKRFAESLLMMYTHKYNLDASIVRVFNTYGPFMSEKDLRVIPRLIRQKLAGKPLTVHGDGTQKRTFCFITDLVEGLKIVMGKGERGEAYNIGSIREVSIFNLAKIITRVSSKDSAIVFEPRPAHDHQSRMPDITKMKLLGWYPKIELEKGVEKTLNNYLKAQEEIPDKIS